MGGENKVYSPGHIINTPIKQAVIASLMVLPDDAVICADPGTPCPYFHTTMASGWPAFQQIAHGALGYSLAAAIGAQVGRPNATVLPVMGDGSFNFSCGDKTMCVISCQSRCFVFSTKHLAGLRRVRILALINGFTMLILGRQIMPQ